MVARTRLNVTLCQYCLCCYIKFLSSSRSSKEFFMRLSAQILWTFLILSMHATYKLHIIILLN